MASWPRRVYRLLRSTQHVLAGLICVCLLFPLIDTARRRKITQRWSATLLRILNIRVTRRGSSMLRPGNVLIVANHTSWLDIMVIDSVQASRFVAKAELERWPIVGRLIAGSGTLFIDRSRRHAHRLNKLVVDLLCAGESIAIFPEGAITDGTVLLPFHSSLLQPVIDSQGEIQPLAIRYQRADGSRSTAPAFDGEISFLTSLGRVLSERSIEVGSPGTELEFAL